MEKYEPGSNVLDHHTKRRGRILDVAAQYPHPQAKPNHCYLIRWDDGQVQAYMQAAFGNHGLEVVD